MELENIMLSEINQLVKDKYHMIHQLEEYNEQYIKKKYNYGHGNMEWTNSDQRSGE